MISLSVPAYTRCNFPHGTFNRTAKFEENESDIGMRVFENIPFILKINDNKMNSGEHLSNLKGK